MGGSTIELLSRGVRRLPPVIVRVLLLLDVVLVPFPVWGWFFFSRWTGRLLGPREFVKIWLHGLRFAWAHALHFGEGTGPLFIEWNSAPVRRSPGIERPDWMPRGSCGSCRNCCTTPWRPEGKRVDCPFLIKTGGCGIYGGIYWDYFNCGRYPAKPQAVAYYSCPRFDATLPIVTTTTMSTTMSTTMPTTMPTTIPAAMPAPVPSEESAAVR